MPSHCTRPRTSLVYKFTTNILLAITAKRGRPFRGYGTMNSRVQVPHGFQIAGAASASESDDSVEAPAPPAPPEPGRNRELAELRASYQHLSGTPGFQRRFAQCVECSEITYYGTPCGLTTLEHERALEANEGWVEAYMGRARAAARYLAGKESWEETRAEARKFPLVA